MTHKLTKEVRDNAYHNFQPFFNGMAQEMVRHFSEQGDSWMDYEAQNMPMDEHLKILLRDAIEDYFITDESDQLIDVANFCAMIWNIEHPRNAWLRRSSKVTGEVEP